MLRTILYHTTFFFQPSNNVYNFDTLALSTPDTLLTVLDSSSILVFSFVLFMCGVAGVIYKWKNFLITMLSIEIMYLGVLTGFVFYGVYAEDTLAGVYALLLLIFAACESAVGLGLLVYTHRFLHTIGGERFFLLQLMPGVLVLPATQVNNSSVWSSIPSTWANALFSGAGQVYVGIIIFAVLITALCFILAGLSYLFSITAAQDTEKRSEYECGFAPFDSATRSPFEIHFYVTGILFLIFDVEISLLFPWVLTVEATGLFSYTLMAIFIYILAVGFYYEWKRGALIWPARYSHSRTVSNVFGVCGGVEFSFLPETALLSLIIFILLGFGVMMGGTQLNDVLIKKCIVFSPRVLLGISFLYVLQTFFVQETLSLGGYFFSSLGVSLSKLIIVWSSLYIVQVSEQYVEKKMNQRHFLEYFVLVFFATLLLLCMVGANNLFSLYLAIGGFSLNLYILILFDTDSRIAREASLKYFVLSALSTGLFIFGTFVLYFIFRAATYGDLRWIFYTTNVGCGILSGVGLFCIIMGMFFKLSAFPAHFWAPDVYEGAPATITAFFLMPVKAGALIALMRLLYAALIGLASYWLGILVWVSVCSISWGAFAALVECKISRFLGYASINQVGYLLLGSACESDLGILSVNSYLVAYLVMSAGFLLIYIHGRRKGTEKLYYISDFRGFGVQERAMAWSLTIFIFSSAGIPPTLGFHVKYLVFTAAILKYLYIPAAIGVAVSLLGAYYYLQFVTTALFEAVNRVYPIRVLLPARVRIFVPTLEAILLLSPLSAPLIIAAMSAIVIAVSATDLYLMVFVDHNSFYFICSL